MRSCSYLLSCICIARVQQLCRLPPFSFYVANLDHIPAILIEGELNP